MDFQPFYISFKLAFLTTTILLFIVVPLAYLFALKRWKGKLFLEAIILLPMALPPTVLGFYFISFLGPNTNIGHFLQERLGFETAFSFEGILLGSILYCFPFMFSAIHTGFKSIPKNIVDSLTILDKSTWQKIFKVYLPLIRLHLVNGIILSFLHAIGAFGIILMIGGGLKETETASVTIYRKMNLLNFHELNNYAIILMLFSYSFILISLLISRNKNKEYA